MCLTSAHPSALRVLSMSPTLTCSGPQGPCVRAGFGVNMHVKSASR